MANFEWDENKNSRNKDKHGISFEDASDIFNDDSRIQFINESRGERRYIAIGKAFSVIMTVVYTTRNYVIRLISARRSRRDERVDYLTNKLSKNEEE